MANWRRTATRLRGLRRGKECHWETLPHLTTNYAMTTPAEHAPDPSQRRRIRELPDELISQSAAGEAADLMAKLIGEAGKVAVIVHDQTSQTGTTRRDGFANRMKEKYPNIEVVAIEYGEGDPVKSADKAKAIMTANPATHHYSNPPQSRKTNLLQPRTHRRAAA